MIFDGLSKLSRVLEGMKDGERVSWSSVWPRPEYPAPDDHLSDKERGMRWLADRRCTAWQVLDYPESILIEKVEPSALTEDSLHRVGRAIVRAGGALEAGTPVRLVLRDSDLLAFGIDLASRPDLMGYWTPPGNGD